MQFLRTLLPTFFIWQFFSLSPFKLTRNTLQPKINKKHTYIAMISVVVQFTVLVYGLYDFKHYTTSENRSVVVFVADIISMALTRITAIVIVIESWLKRSHQIQFLTKIEEIDSIVRTKLMVDLRYDLQQKKYFRGLFVWIGLQVSLELAMAIMSWLVGMHILRTYFAFYTIPLFMCVMRYHQFISYVDLLHGRYKAINACVESFTLTELRNQKKSNPLKNPKNDTHFTYGQTQRTHFRRVRDVEASLVYNKLKHLQRVHRLLVEANKMLSRLFNWSMLFNMTSDFYNLVINSYWVIINFVRGDSKLELIGVFSWGIFNMIMLISVSKACHSACYEVN